SLPNGKLEQVKAMCERNARPFEYAFLLDALKDEQAQGITIDTARCFFKTKKRDYIVLDAPGHIEFLKNMVTGAARAEAALLVIDAHEGIQENSRRHGYLVSMLGINQVTVLVNKMDLVNHSESVFETIRKEYTEFLTHIHVKPVSFIPISAMQGENLTKRSSSMAWYKGKHVLEQLDAFEKKGAVDTLPFRFPVQDIYKFTAQNDERRIVAGTIETGSIQVGDAVCFLPSGKEVTISTIEAFNMPKKSTARAGEAVGFTLSEQIYIRPGEVMVRKTEPQPLTSSRFKANVFWMGKAPLIPGKKYKLKLATARVSVTLIQLISVLDASELEASHVKKQVDRHDVAECIFETAKPIAFDSVSTIESMGRFVMVDHYEIAGGGIISE
ncbi:MAG: GTP-binding protein, partial [Candidatus Margulisiibacteriota bacterium]